MKVMKSNFIVSAMLPEGSPTLRRVFKNANSGLRHFAALTIVLVPYAILAAWGAM